MRKRKWLGTGLVEQFDARQQRLLDRVLDEVRRYYFELHETQPRYRHPLNLSRLATMCRCSGSVALSSLRVLSFSIDLEKEKAPPLTYVRETDSKIPSRRAYRIYLSRSARLQPVDPD